MFCQHALEKRAMKLSLVLQDPPAQYQCKKMFGEVLFARIHVAHGFAPANAGNFKFYCFQPWHQYITMFPGELS